LAPGLPFLASNLDPVIDPDRQQSLIFGTNHFDTFLDLTWPASRHCFYQICQFVLASLKLFMQLIPGGRKN
ncbi:hypothetical protein, partial [Pseudomonas aeruginosa]|uniref:hypothetical protein n=1 Tax=Pseudomonas aeruginosa TaxID=287 RepID=UPI001CF09E1E